MPRYLLEMGGEKTVSVMSPENRSTETSRRGLALRAAADGFMSAAGMFSDIQA